MSREGYTKEGLDFFPLNTLLDDKWKLVEAEFGLTGFAVIVKMLQRIYGQHGYYSEWNDEVALLFAGELRLGGNVVSEIVSASIRRGIFDQEMYEKYRILTSNGIQKRYFEAVSRRKALKIERRYLLGDYAQKNINVDIYSKNVDIYRKNADIYQQKKRKEKKVKESKEAVEESVKTKLGNCYDYYRRRLDEFCKKKEIVLPDKVMIDWYEEDIVTFGGKEELERRCSSFCKNKIEENFDVEEFFNVAIEASKKGG